MKYQQFKALPTKKKAAYLIDTVFWHVLLGGILIFLIGSMIYEDYIKPESYMNVEMINACQESPDGESFEPFLEAEGYCCKERKVEVSKVFQLGNDPGDIKGDPEILLMCNIAAGNTDVYFWDTDELEPALMKRALIDLREVLPREFLEAHADQLVYSAPVLEGGFPCGIRLVNNPWITENNYYGDCVVGISRCVKDPAMVRAFLEYLL